MNLSKYINLKFKYKGRDFNGVDCFGLLYLIYKSELNILLPDFNRLVYSDNWWIKNKQMIVENVWDNWYEVSQPTVYDCLLFYNSYKKQIVNHIGVYVTDNQFIHVVEQEGSSLNKLDSKWGEWLYKILRYRTD